MTTSTRLTITLYHSQVTLHSITWMILFPQFHINPYSPKHTITIGTFPYCQVDASIIAVLEKFGSDLASSRTQVFNTIARMLSKPIAFAVHPIFNCFLIPHGVQQISWRLASVIQGSSGGITDRSFTRHIWLKMVANPSVVPLPERYWAPSSLRVEILVEPLWQTESIEES